MPGRAYLSEEAEEEERKDRDRLYELRGKLRELVDKRRVLLGEFHRLSDEQRVLYEARAPKEEEVERVHREYQELGHALSRARTARDAARHQLEESVAELREFQALNPRAESSRPEEIRREVAELERRQQTQTLSLTDENALIDRLRALTKRAEEAEKGKTRAEEREKRIHALEKVVAERLALARKAAEELPRLRAERDQRMQSIRGRLAASGELVSQIREKAKARGAAMDRVRTISAEIDGLEREADQLARNSRQRRDEARQAIGAYRQGVRATGSARGASDAQVADRQLEELLKRGRVTLRG